MSRETPPRVDLVSLAGITPSGYPSGFIPRCPRCRYDLTGLKRSRCPECGAPFSVQRLYEAWLERKRSGAGDLDFLLAALLVLPASAPADLGDPFSQAWKLPILGAMWCLSLVWLRRRRLELREPDEGHRLLWLWVPLAATATGVSATPGLNAWAAAVLLGLAVLVMSAAWRRSPGPTSMVVTIVLAVPCAVGTLVGVFMISDGLSGVSQGAFWSQSDYPAWYWHGVPGRVRGMNNHDAVRIGMVVLALCAAALVVAVGLWLMVARRWRRVGASPAAVTLRAGSVPRRRPVHSP